MRIAEFWRRVCFAWRRRRHLDDLDEEMRLHAELRAAQLLANGMPREEAGDAAQRRFGNRTALKEAATDLWAFTWLEEIGRDLLFAARGLRKSLAFTLSAVLSLALGIGANTAVFSLLNALAFRPLPVKAPQQLVRIGSLENNGMIHPVPGPLLDELRQEPLLNGICGFTAGDAIVEVDGNSSALATHSLTGDCYQTLGVRAALGRLFTRADDIQNGPKVAVLSFDFWQTRFAGNPSVLGRSIRIAGAAFQIIGVTEPRFQGLVWGQPASVSAPIAQRTEAFPQDLSRRFYWAETLARLKPEARRKELQVQLNVKWRRLLDAAYPAGFKGANREELVSMPPVVTTAAAGVDYYFREHFQRSLVALLAVSVLILLAACFNVANLLLARGLQRQREIAIRLAIGAERWRIVRQLVTESALLLAAGLAMAFGISLAGINLAINTFTTSYARADIRFEAHMDWRVLLFAGLAAVIAVIVFGIFPAWQISDVSSATAMKSGSRSVIGGIAGSRRLLLSGQVALTLVILIAANVFGESLGYLRGQALRFESSSVLNAQLMPLPGGDVYGEQAVSYFRQLMERIKDCPGVNAASLTSFAPLVSAPYKEDVRRLDQPDHVALQAPAEFVTEDFLSIMHIPLLHGRNFEGLETPKTPRAAIISEFTAERLFGKEDAIGKHIQFGTEPETRDVQVVGVVPDSSLEDPHTRQQGFVLLNLWQLLRMGNWGNLQIRFSGKPEIATKALQEEIRKAGHQQIFQLRTMTELRAMSLLQERLLAATGRIYAVLALLLAAVGLFGLLTFFVTRRKSEIAIRMALGAERRDIGLLVIKETVVLLGCGILAGLLFSYAAVRVLATLLYGVSPLLISPVTLSLGTLCAVVAAAVVVPIYRATAIDPNIALRQE
jgi:predicted permease